MEFKQIEYNDSSDSILKVIQENITIASKMEREITNNRRRQHPKAESKEVPNKIKTPTTPETVQEIKVDEEFEDALACYLEDYQTLSDNFTKKALELVLPTKSDYRYQDIIIRLHLSSLKEIKELSELLTDENNTKEDLEEIKHLIRLENKKIKLLKEISAQKETEKSTDNEKKITIILAPTSTGSIRLLEELKRIPNDFYFQFIEIITSLEKGVLRRVKAFVEIKDFKGIRELRCGDVRIVFKRLSNDKYALITGFVKRNADQAYREHIQHTILDYKQIEEQLKKVSTEEDFLCENEKRVMDLKNILGNKKESKVAKKVGDK